MTGQTIAGERDIWQQVQSPIGHQSHLGDPEPQPGTHPSSPMAGLTRRPSLFRVLYLGKTVQ